MLTLLGYACVPIVWSSSWGNFVLVPGWIEKTYWMSGPISAAVVVVVTWAAVKELSNGENDSETMRHLVLASSPFLLVFLTVFLPASYALTSVVLTGHKVSREFVVADVKIRVDSNRFSRCQNPVWLEGSENGLDKVCNLETEVASKLRWGSKVRLLGRGNSLAIIVTDIKE